MNFTIPNIERGKMATICKVSGSSERKVGRIGTQYPIPHYIMNDLPIPPHNNNKAWDGNGTLVGEFVNNIVFDASGSRVGEIIHGKHIVNVNGRIVAEIVYKAVLNTYGTVIGMIYSNADDRKTYDLEIRYGAAALVLLLDTE